MLFILVNGVYRRASSARCVPNLHTRPWLKQPQFEGLKGALSIRLSWDLVNIFNNLCLIFSVWTGMLWQELKQVYNEGLYGYFDSLYNYLDCAVLLLYISSFTLRYLSIIKVRLYILYVGVVH